MTRQADRGSLRWLLALLLALVMLPVSPAATAQTDDRHVTAAGNTVTWSAPWAIDNARTAPPGSTIDILVLRDGGATVGIVTGPFTLSDATRGLILGYLGADTEAAIPVDQGASGVLSYWLDVVPMPDGTTAGAFTTAVQPGGNGILTMALGPIDTFGATITSAQTSIAIDGAPLFEGVEGTGLQAALEAAAPAATPAPAAEAPFAVAGAWTDPVHGFTVEWAAGWGEPTVRNTNTMENVNAADGLVVDITGMARAGATPQDWADRMTQQIAAAGGEVSAAPPHIGEQNAIVSGTIAGMPMINEAIFLDDGETVVLVTLGVLGDDVDAAVGRYQATMRIDGRTPLEGWGATAAAERTPPSRVEEVPYLDAGMIGPASWRGPQHGIEVQWSTTWQLDSYMTPPVVSDTEIGEDRVHLELIENDAICVAVVVDPWDGRSMDAVAGLITSDRTITAVYGDKAEVVMSSFSGDRGALVIRDTSTLVPWIIYDEFYVMNGGSSLVNVRLTAPVTVFEQGLTEAQAAVTLFGLPILTYFPAADAVAASRS